MDVIFGSFTPALAKCCAGEVFRGAGVGEAIDIVNVGQIKVGTSFEHQNSLLLANFLGQVVSQDAAAAHAPANDHQVEITLDPV